MKNHWQKFKKEVAAKNPEDAKEMIFSDFGSKHRVKRKFIEIETIEEISIDHVENVIVRWKVEGQK